MHISTMKLSAQRHGGAVPVIPSKEYGKALTGGSAPEPTLYDGSRQARWEREIRLRAIARDDPQEARAQEFEELGYRKRALRVRECGNPTGRYIVTLFCGDRFCPRCGRFKASRRARKMAAGVRSMTEPVFCTFRFDTTCATFEALTDGMSKLRKALARLRRRVVFATVKGGHGGLETPPTHDGIGWGIHLHIVLDVPLHLLDVRAVRQQWSDLTEGRGTFWIDEVEVEDEEDVAFYSTKPRTTSPPPVDTALDRLAALVAGLKGKRLVVAWGSGQPRTSRDAPAKQPVQCGGRQALTLAGARASASASLS